jgi:hypothetical protein
VKVPNKKVGELGKTLELRDKSKKKFRANEGIAITQSSRRKTRSTQEEKFTAPTFESSRRKMRKVHEKKFKCPSMSLKRRKGDCLRRKFLLMLENLRKHQG